MAAVKIEAALLAVLVLFVLPSCVTATSYGGGYSASGGEAGQPESGGASGSATGGVSGAAGASGGFGSVASGGAAGSDACTPKTCEAESVWCGPLDDGCGGTLDCGSCATGNECVDGSCQACDLPQCTDPDFGDTRCGTTLSNACGMVACGACKFGTCNSTFCTCHPIPASNVQLPKYEFECGPSHPHPYIGAPCDGCTPLGYGNIWCCN